VKELKPSSSGSIVKPEVKVEIVEEDEEFKVEIVEDQKKEEGGGFSLASFFGIGGEVKVEHVKEPEVKVEIVEGEKKEEENVPVVTQEKPSIFGGFSIFNN